MDTADLVSKAAEYTEKFVNAAIPVAKKAYEIGLLTIRIDGLSVLIPALFVIICYVLCMRWMLNHRNQCIAKWKANNERGSRFHQWWEYSIFDAAGYGMTIGVLTIIAIGPVVLVLNLWLWVKIFYPDLWLAHEAIIKVMEHVAK